MSIAEHRRGHRARASLTAGLLLGLLGASPVAAHPVAQGAMELTVFADRLAVRATVSSEQVLVAAALGGPKGASPLESFRAHGEYLLAHLHVTADGHPVAGRLVNVPEAVTDKPRYALEYRWIDGRPARIALGQDVLREFDFAPGNPWEASYVVRVVHEAGPALEGLLLTWRAPLVVSARARGGWFGGDAPAMAGEFLRHGVAHILSGYDHLLFIVALALVVRSVWELVTVVSAFTLAHSITLTLSVLNLARLPAGVVEPMIAASIVFVAAQNAFVPERSRGRGRLAVAFFFGLFHGLGFAGGLVSAMEGMPGVAVGVAIASFSAGVEIGHQVVVAPLFAGLQLMRRREGAAFTRAGERLLRYGSAGLSLAGIVYLVAALR